MSGNAANDAFEIALQQPAIALRCSGCSAISGGWSQPSYARLVAVEARRGWRRMPLTMQVPWWRAATVTVLSSAVVP
jgi:hypothetical protein